VSSRHVGLEGEGNSRAAKRRCAWGILARVEVSAYAVRKSVDSVLEVLHLRLQLEVA